MLFWFWTGWDPKNCHCLLLFPLPRFLPSQPEFCALTTQDRVWARNHEDDRASSRDVSPKLDTLRWIFGVAIFRGLSSQIRSLEFFCRVPEIIVRVCSAFYRLYSAIKLALIERDNNPSAGNAPLNDDSTNSHSRRQEENIRRHFSSSAIKRRGNLLVWKLKPEIKGPWREITPRQDKWRIVLEFLPDLNAIQKKERGREERGKGEHTRRQIKELTLRAKKRTRFELCNKGVAPNLWQIKVFYLQTKAPTNKLCKEEER